MSRIALFGYGKMGKEVEALAKKEGDTVVSLDQAEVAIDFSHSSVVLKNLERALSCNIPLVIGTTGWEESLSKAQHMVAEREGTALYGPNFSLGVTLYSQIVERAHEIFRPFQQYSCAGIEWHHKEKVDAPSGTAKRLEQILEGKVHFTSMRCGHIPGTHTILYDSEDDTISLTHTARSRKGFAQGALTAAAWIIGKKGWFTFDEMVRSFYSFNHTLQRESSRP